ncbi:unnamed protein product [Lupinus luteus]|uniref:Uncharacterized protein n=1 Tax=Lupinus luteus TaxID=3873 RepID=A0AAV1WPC0_LUPLU
MLAGSREDSVRRPLHSSFNNTVGAFSIGFFFVLILHMRSIEYRATVNSTKEMISIATFHRPGMIRNLAPIPSLVTPERPAFFERIGVEDYYNGFFSHELQGKSYIDIIRLQHEISK